LIDGLRSVARQSRHQKRRRFEVLLCRRAAAVSGELLGLAALLDITDDPDPAAIDSLLTLLTDGVESPLYNPRIHVAELHATLVDSRRRLLRGALSTLDGELASAGGAGEQQAEESVEQLGVERLQREFSADEHLAGLVLGEAHERSLAIPVQELVGIDQAGR
jgi:hypothetical protein